METNPFISLSSVLENPAVTYQKIQRMFRAELVRTYNKDLDTKLSSLERKLKNLARVPAASRDPNWHACIRKLTVSAANKTMKLASSNPFFALAGETGHTVTEWDIRAIFRKVWDPAYDKWLDLPRKVREQVEEEILEKIILPEEASEKAEFRRRVKGMTNLGGKRSWASMNDRAKRNKRKREMGGESEKDGSGSEKVEVAEKAAVGDERKIGNYKRKKVGVSGEPLPTTLAGEATATAGTETETVAVRKSRPAGVTLNEGGAETLGRLEAIEHASDVSSNEGEKEELRRDEEKNKALSIGHNGGETDMLAPSEGAQASTKVEAAEETCVAPQISLQDGETNNLRTMENATEIIVLSDDEGPVRERRRRRRGGNIAVQVIDLGSGDEWERAASQPDEIEPDFIWEDL